MLSPRPMVEFPDLPEQPRNSGYHARLWNRRSGGWASISTDKSEQLRNRRQASSALPSHPQSFSPHRICNRFLNVRHFSGGEAIAEDELSNGSSRPKQNQRCCATCLIVIG